MSKKSNIVRPNRDPDHYSKRGVAYWWSPEWVRGTSSDEIFTLSEGIKTISFQIYQDDCIRNDSGDFVRPCESYGKIAAIKDKQTGDVHLYMKSKDGDMSFIQGSIQREFKQWHLDRQIDYILLGLDEDEIIKDDND